VRPEARHDDLITSELDDEILVYDPGQQLVCRLNRTAAQVWQLADGRHTISELARLLDPVSPDRELVVVALDQLQASGLLEAGYPQADAEAAQLNRRRFMRRVGVAGVAVAVAPVVEAVVMPTAAHASSGGPPPPP
jgi:hypothetical protein